MARGVGHTFSEIDIGSRNGSGKAIRNLYPIIRAMVLSANGAAGRLQYWRPMQAMNSTYLQLQVCGNSQRIIALRREGNSAALRRRLA